MSSDNEKTELNYKAIASGWKNYIFKSESIEELAKTRAKVCSECPNINTNYMFKKILPDKSLENIQGTACNLCGCPLSSKLRQVLENCPEKKW
jgi:hypothetical protein